MTDSDRDSEQEDLNKNPATWDGLSRNVAYTLKERLELAHKACDLYEARCEDIIRRHKIALLNLSLLALAEFARSLEPLVLALADFQALVNKEVNEGD